MPTASVVIRNKNEAHFLDLVLQALKSQEMQLEDIIVVDNNSSDNSVEVALRYGCKVVPLSEFTYGKALNVGFQQAKGEVIIVLSAHSLPIGPSFVKEALKPFHDKSVAAVRFIMVSKAYDAKRWFKPEVLSFPISPSEVISKGPIASGCAISRSVWCEIPFDEQQRIKSGPMKR